MIPNAAGHRMNTRRNLSFSVSSRPGALFLFFLPAGEGWTVVFPTSLGRGGGITMLVVGSELSDSDTDTDTEGGGGGSGGLEGWEAVARPT